MADVYQRLQELGWALPSPPKLAGNYVLGKLWGNTLYVSGQTPKDKNGEPVLQGKLGRERSVEQGQEAARMALLDCLAGAEAILGDLNRVETVLKMMVYVNSAPEFDQQPSVGNGASDALVAIFGEAGRHARTSIGVNSLPAGNSVEIDLILGVRS